MPTKEEIFNHHSSEVDNWNNALVEKDAYIAMEEYAEQEAIVFAECIRYNGVFNSFHKLWNYQDKTDLTTADFYQLFKSQQQTK